MNFTFDKWVYNVIPVTNPTQYTKSGKYIVKSQESHLVKYTPKSQRHEVFFLLQDLFDRIDVNHDGSISRAELEDALRSGAVGGGLSNDTEATTATKGIANRK